MSGMQRSKGAAGEREVVQLLRSAFPDVARRAAGEESQEDRGRDLKNTPGFVVQVQLARAPTPEKKFLEAFGARRHGEVAVAITRRSAKRKKDGGAASGSWLATLFAADLAALLSERDRLKKLDAGKLEEERDRIRAERDQALDLLERSRGFDPLVEGAVHPVIAQASVNALEILKLEREVARLKEANVGMKLENVNLREELGRALFGAP